MSDHRAASRDPRGRRSRGGFRPAAGSDPAPAEGRIKFRLHWSRDEPPSGIRKLVYWRNRLHRAGLIGAYPDGVGYGNVSVRANGGFIISGTATGVNPVTSAADFTRVTDYSIEACAVHCRGPVAASSESLTHAAVYEASPAVMAVVHAHHRGIWGSLMGKAHTTALEIPCGSTGMTLEITRLFEDTDVETDKFFIMGGHEEGLVAFGGSLRAASLILLGLLRHCQSEHRWAFRKF